MNVYHFEKAARVLETIQKLRADHSHVACQYDEVDFELLQVFENFALVFGALHAFVTESEGLEPMLLRNHKPLRFRIVGYDSLYGGIQALVGDCLNNRVQVGATSGNENSYFE